MDIGGKSPQPSVIREGGLLCQLDDERVRLAGQGGIGIEEGLEEIGPL